MKFDFKKDWTTLLGYGSMHLINKQVKKMKMLDFQKVVATIKEYSTVDFDCESDGGIVWFHGINCYYVVGNIKDNKLILTVWKDDDCDEVIENFEIQSLDKLNTCLDKYALISDEKVKESQVKELIDTTMIDIYVNAIKEKLAEKQISLDFEKQSPTERLVINHIENKLVEIIDFLQ